jgi:hypothetical protein
MLQDGVLGGAGIIQTGRIFNVVGVSINENVVKLVEWVPVSMTIMIDMTCFLGGKVFSGLFLFE